MKLKFYFVAILLAILPVSRIPAATTTINLTQTYQTIEGLGGATAFYNGWITGHPYAMEICTNAFAGLNLSMLRVGDWYSYQTPILGFDTATLIVSNANRVLGHPVPVFMSSWAPPAFLKSNGQVGNGGTLLFTNGSFAYTNFAQYWYDSINAYQSNGVTLTWMSIQNEPNFQASYSSCELDPTEDTVNGTNFASYAKALNATYARLTNMPSMPKILAPETDHIQYSALSSYAQYMSANTFYGVTTHLYGDSPGTTDTPATADGNISSLRLATNYFPTMPHFMTEFEYSNLLSTACLIHDCLTVENDAGFNYWSLVWPNGGYGLIITETNYSNPSTWVNAPPGTPTQSHGWWYSPAYWAMKHFSYFIQPGYVRVGASDTDNNVRSSAFLSPDGLRLVVVLINTNNTASSTMSFNFGTFNYGVSSVYQTAGTNTYAETNTFLPLGAVTSPEIIPPQSITTIVLDQAVPVGPATNEVPVVGAMNVPLNSLLSWTPGSNALTHLVYLGLNSNAVAQANPTSQEFQGDITNTNFNASLAAGLTYFWRVDEVAGVNTNPGPVWSFSTVAPSTSYALNGNDGFNSTSFNTTGNWVTNGTANAATSPPGPSGTYNTATYTLRTPISGNATFGGSTLTLSAGAPVADGSLLLKGPNGATVVVNDLIMSGGVLAQGVNSGSSGIEWVSGNMNVVNNSGVSGLGTTARYIGIASDISGSGSLSNDCNVIYSGNNAGFTGPMIVGSGGAIQINSQQSLGDTEVVLNNGTFQPNASMTINNPGGTVTLGSGGGAFQIGSGLTLSISNPIGGAGNLFSTGGGILQLAGNNTATGNLIVSNSTLEVLDNATFQNAQLGIGNNATLDVSAQTVPLMISNSITLAGNLIEGVNNNGNTSELVTSNLTYGGTLTLSNTGPALAYGNTLKLFSASNYSGTFSSIIPAVPGTGLLWYTNWISVNGTLFVTSTNPALMTPPSISSFQLVGGNITVNGTNGNAPGTVFYLLASTNLSLPITNWTIVATNQFGAGGGFNSANTINTTQPLQYFILLVP